MRGQKWQLDSPHAQQPTLALALGSSSNVNQHHTHTTAHNSSQHTTHNTHTCTTVHALGHLLAPPRSIKPTHPSNTSATDVVPDFSFPETSHPALAVSRDQGNRSSRDPARLFPVSSIHSSHATGSNSFISSQNTEQRRISRTYANQGQACQVLALLNATQLLVELRAICDPTTTHGAIVAPSPVEISPGRLTH
jgi:cytochrome c biogenesis protein ResB